MLKQLSDTVTRNSSYTHDDLHKMINHHTKGTLITTKKGHIFIPELKLYLAGSTSAVRHRSLSKDLLLLPSTQKLRMSYVIKLTLLGEVPQHHLTVLAVWLHPELLIQKSVLLLYH